MIDTWGPFYAAYTLTALLYAGYMFSLWRRSARLAARLRRTGDDAPTRSRRAE